MHRRTHRNRFLAAAMTAMVLVSLSAPARATSKKEIDRSKLPQIQVGVTTREQVEQLLGKPDSKAARGDLVLLQYMHLKMTEPTPEKVIGTASAIVSPIGSLLFMPSHDTVHERLVMIETASDGKVVRACTMTEDYKSSRAPLIAGGGILGSMEGGRVVTPEEAARIKVNETTRDEVEALLGTTQIACESQYTPEEVARIKANKTNREKTIESKWMTEASRAHEFDNGFCWCYTRYAGKNMRTFAVHFGPDGKVIRAVGSEILLGLHALRGELEEADLCGLPLY